MARELEFVVPQLYHERKLCAFLRGDAQISYALCATLRHTPGAVTRGGEIVRSIDRVHAGDVIRVRFPEERSSLTATEMALDVLYLDEDLLAVNKPGCLATHPSHGHPDDTLANGVAFYLAAHGLEGDFHAVGRLDKGTSGVAVCALHAYAASRMAGQGRKTYLALTAGELHGAGTVDAPIFRPDPNKTTRCCDPRGESAVTDYRVLRSGGGYSLVLLWPRTGRTHQIRVHMASLGAPLVGDSLYGEAIPALGRHLLHCARVDVPHPVTGEMLRLEAPLPPEFSAALREAFGTDFVNIQDF